MNQDKHEIQVRIARNQSLFREVNERVEHLQKAWAPVSEIDFICECADETCTAPITMTVAEYEFVRQRSNRFAIVAEHVYPEAEIIVAKNDRYWTVEKIEAAARVTAALDPR
jgi:hypothetical protein